MKLCSICLCSNVPGQLMTGLMVNPPTSDAKSKYDAEKEQVLTSLKRRSEKVHRMLKELPGVTCNPAQGAMYLFPKLTLPKKAVEEALRVGVAADGLYCLELLRATGLVVVPGSGFGQSDGSWHFRITFLPPEHLLDDVLGRLQAFHTQFMAKYA